MTTDPGLPTTAAGKRASMAAEPEKAATRYGDTVQKITTGPAWTGVSATTAAHSAFKGTRYGSPA